MSEEIQHSLSGNRIAVLVADGFEEPEFTEPVDALREAGAEVVVVSPVEGDRVKAWDGAVSDWGDSYPVHLDLAKAIADEFDGLLLPGGVMNPDTLRTNQDALDFVASFFTMELPVGAICHAPQILIDAIELEGRRMTSYNSIKTDVENAGALWVDEEAVVDGNLVTSRNPDDIPAFLREFSGLLAGVAA
ncbi:MAG: type 1 glutamine amidotransferase domain-containing protein [Verrucomicrobiales bacterium]